MAAVFDPRDPSSPLAYPPSQTALILLDFQNIVIQMCGEAGKAVLANAKKLRDWALTNNIFVLHSVIDIDREPRATARGQDRMKGLLGMVRQNPGGGEEAPEIAADPDSKSEVLVKKQAGFVSGLKAPGATEALHERDIKSLIVCGLSTSGAALRTSLAATDDGFVVTMIEDACADRVDGLHEMLTNHVVPMTAHVATAEELLSAYGTK